MTPAIPNPESYNEIHPDVLALAQLLYDIYKETDEGQLK